MQLTVIIVNYNVRYFLEQALLSVRRASAGMEVEVFVVDNASEDGSCEMVRQYFPETILIENKDNVGFSRANNQAIEKASGKYVLLLNPDTVVEEDTFQKCYDFMEAHPEGGGLGVKMIDGSGSFLPESKRGFPTPFVAFSKTFGLSKLFPRSPLFNRYHLGFLSEDETHEVDVLSGAFMWIRVEALEKSGYLDEDFFMYGEDIDLSYRIQKAGYKNYYFAETKIIHYKGESTRKGSLNYVRTFYQAMIIFARKHFSGSQAGTYIFLIRLGIYFRALLTVLSTLARKAFLPLLDALLLLGGMLFLKDFWARHYFNDPDYYQHSYIYFNFGLYILFWLLSIYFSGGYENPFRLRRLVRGLLAGTLAIAAVYGFMDLRFRTSRVLILLGFTWGALSLSGLRTLLYFLKNRDFSMGMERKANLIIVGTEEESNRVQDLLRQAQVERNFIGTVTPMETEVDHKTYLSSISDLDNIVQIYKVDEVIFCSKDIRTESVLNWMTRLGPEVEYRIVPEESLSIIGSSSRNTSGELYTIDIRFRIAEPMNRRNKRLLDVLLALALLISFPLHLLWLQKPLGLVRNCWLVLMGKKSWVGYADVQEKHNLPSLRSGILSPLDGLHLDDINMETRKRLNFLYAKDYRTSEDLLLIWKGRNALSRY
jgi:GT2 family glycosyltransferase